MRKIVFSILAVACVFNLSAHENFAEFKVFGRITTCIDTGFDYEDRYRIQIIGQMADSLSDHMGNKTNLRIDYIHRYYTSRDSEPMLPLYRVGYGEYRTLKNGRFVDKEGLIVRIIADKLDVGSILKLVEYALSNRKEIEATVSPVVDSLSQFSKYVMNAIDSTTVKTALGEKISSMVADLMDKRFYRPEKCKDTWVTYYYKNGKYHIVSHRTHGQERELAVFDDIYYICGDNQGILVFDTRDSFTYVDHFGSVFQKHFFAGGWRPYMFRRIIPNDDGLLLIIFNNINLESSKQIVIRKKRDGTTENYMVVLQYKVMLYNPYTDTFEEEGSKMIFDSLLSKQ